MAANKKKISPEKAAAIVADYKAGMPWKVIIETHKVSIGTVRNKIADSGIEWRNQDAHRKRYASHGLRRTKKTQRDCLKCGRTFMSDGKHNRICSNCNESNANMDGNMILNTQKVRTDRSGGKTRGAP